MVSLTLFERAVLIYFAAMWVISFFVTVYDKLAAKVLTRHRIREASLILLASAGGAPAMLFAMLLVRHKTKHPKVFIPVSVFALVYILLALMIVLKIF